MSLQNQWSQGLTGRSMARAGSLHPVVNFRRFYVGATDGFDHLDTTRIRNGQAGSGMVRQDQEWSGRIRNGQAGSGMVRQDQEWSGKIMNGQD